MVEFSTSFMQFSCVVSPASSNRTHKWTCVLRQVTSAQ